MDCVNQRSDCTLSPLCRCGEVESNTHYFFECRFYPNIRTTLRQHISAKSAFKIDTVLFGDSGLSLVENEQVFHGAHLVKARDSLGLNPIKG